MPESQELAGLDVRHGSCGTEWSMGLRISTKPSGGVTVVRIDGRLRKEGAAELEKVCQSIEGPFCIDLANLQSVDADGIRTISELEADGVAITGVSPYIDMLLKRAGHT